MKTEGDVYERVKHLVMAFLNEEAERLKILDGIPPIDEERMRKYINENYPDSCKPITINGNDSNGLFPFGKFKIAVNPDSPEPPHFHVLSEGWDVTVGIGDCRVLKINAEGKDKAVCEYIGNHIKEWLMSPSANDDCRTNKGEAVFAWKHKN